jgi:hypothetical protein
MIVSFRQELSLGDGQAFRFRRGNDQDNSQWWWAFPCRSRNATCSDFYSPSLDLQNEVALLVPEQQYKLEGEIYNLFCT